MKFFVRSQCVPLFLMSRERTIVVVDDDTGMSQAIERLLTVAGWKPREAHRLFFPPPFHPIPNSSIYDHT